MKRLETLARIAKDDLRTKDGRYFDRNGVDAIEIARALDKLKAADKVLRRAYEVGA